MATDETTTTAYPFEYAMQGQRPDHKAIRLPETDRAAFAEKFAHTDDERRGLQIDRVLQKARARLAVLRQTAQDHPDDDDVRAEIAELEDVFTATTTDAPEA